MATERELKILNLLATDGASNQRQVADAAGFSLGLVNNIVNRLVETGHIKVRNLTAKRVRYILTPKGIAEKARQGYAYLRSTVKTYNSCLRSIQQIIAMERESGKRRFVILGEGEIADLVETALRLESPPDLKYERRMSIGHLTPDAATSVLDCRVPHGRRIGVSVLSAILDSNNAVARAARMPRRPVATPAIKP